jgi:hypothetical protein
MRRHLASNKKPAFMAGFLLMATPFKLRLPWAATVYRATPTSSA